VNARAHPTGSPPLDTAPGAPGGLESLARPPRQKITGVRLVPLRTVREIGWLEPAWDPGGRIRFRLGGGSFLEIRSDQGLVGIGPAIDASMLPMVNEQLRGTDPWDVESHAARLGYHTRGRLPGASAGVDIALWDLIGKACEQPLATLWGGEKEKVLVYASTIQLARPDPAVALTAELRDEGWRAVKLRLHHESLDDDLATAEALRDAVGDRLELMADANQAQSPGGWQPGVRWDLARALATARTLEELRYSWLEEPLPRYAFELLAELNRLVELPIAGGENNSGLHEFGWMIERAVYDILQPDCRVAGGITELRRIGALARAAGKPIVPHHGGGSLGTIAHLHLVASWPHAPYLELLHEPPIGSYQHRFAIFKDPPAVDADGYLGVPRGPGLGVEIDPDLVERP
jgi:L-alanine-DL-glutamate epimerase-like enolase superfamily enzyme